MILAQNIRLQWHKNCRGGLGAIQRNQFLHAAKLPLDFFDYIPFGIPVHWMLTEQKLDEFQPLIDRRVIEKFNNKHTLCLFPMELIPKEDGSCEIRYRYDWHQGAMPERHKYDPASSRYVPLNELAMELGPGEYGRAICNGRFVDFDTGNWWYELNITNVLIQTKKQALLDCFLTNTPTHYYHQIAKLR